MQNEELLAVVTEVYYRQKKSREDVKKALLSKGWKEEDINTDDIDKTIDHVRNQALRNLPVISSIYGFFDNLEARYAHLSTKAVIIILIIAVLWLILVAFAIYLMYDPFSVVNVPSANVQPPVLITPGAGDTINF